MDLSIIIVSWNVKELLKKNLKEIFQNTKNIKFEIFVIDNNSQDKTVEMIKKEFPQVNLIVNNYNAGFAKANNQGIKKVKGKYILLLNPDMKVLDNTLENMVNWMNKNKNVGVSGCHLIDNNNRTISHVRKFPTLFDQLMIVLKIPHIFPKVLNKYLMKDFNYNKEAEVDSIRGAFFMIRREVIDKLVGLDERYFIWFEEVDFCKQVYVAGGEVWYTPVAECIDYVGQSFNQVDRKVKQNYFKDSQLKYFKKWHSIWQYFVLKIAWVLGKIITNVLEVFHVKGKGKT